MISPPTPSPTWVERYETLRRHVLAGGPTLDLEPLGLVLWRSQGMAGWLRCWARAVPLPPPAPVVASPRPRFPATSLWQQQLTGLLAQMAVQQLYSAPAL